MSSTVGHMCWWPKVGPVVMSPNEPILGGGGGGGVEEGLRMVKCVHVD